MGGPAPSNCPSSPPVRRSVFLDCLTPISLPIQEFSDPSHKQTNKQTKSRPSLDPMSPAATSLPFLAFTTVHPSAPPTPSPTICDLSLLHHASQPPCPCQSRRLFVVQPSGSSAGPVLHDRAFKDMGPCFWKFLFMPWVLSLFYPPSPVPVPLNWGFKGHSKPSILAPYVQMKPIRFQSCFRWG